jgi:hypothetical protein
MAGLAEFVEARTRPGAGGPDARYVQVEASRNSLRMAQSARSQQFARQTLATLFWWCYVRTSQFQLSLPHTRPEDRHEIVVSHANGQNYDLLVLIPGIREPYTVGVAPTATTSSRSSPLADQIRVVAEEQVSQLRGMLKDAGIDASRENVVSAMTELAMFATFQVVFAAEPELTATEFSAVDRVVTRSLVAPAPARTIAVAGDSPLVATAGVIGAVVRPDCVFVITANHAVKSATVQGRKLLVSGAAAKVAACRELTDSCLLTVACEAEKGRARILNSVPAEHRPASFDGAASGHKQTMIRGYDLSVLDSNPYLSSKVYTDPDTIPGDSGAALIDSDGRIVGFAVSRTALGAALEFSTWSWACQVLDAYGLVH